MVTNTRFGPTNRSRGGLSVDAHVDAHRRVQGNRHPAQAARTLNRLIKATASEKLWGIGMFSHPARVMLYRVADFTGLRAQELASLTAQFFDLDGNTPNVRVEACNSKHRRQDPLPLEIEQ